ncbi:MAG: T9SS type A sorting domain-containing protein [candidate division Zixibacteria bacterium]|nr:T9SS type A sorting domain-containing protein [candidate division Zixibacteria bacterium]
MAKKLLLIMLAVSLVAFLTSQSIAEIKRVPIEQAAAKEKLPLDNNLYNTDKPAYPYRGGDVTSPGEMVGTTWYDYQTNGSAGHRVAVHDCGIHMAWMNLLSQSGDRLAYYNFMDNDGNLGWSEGTAASIGPRDGYVNLVSDAEGKAVIAYHDFSSLENYHCYIAVDAACGFGLFTSYSVPSEFPGEGPLVWPYIAYDNQRRIHVTNTEYVPNAGDSQDIGHTYSEDGGANWTDLALYDPIDIMDISGSPTASRVDDKVALIYTKPIDDGGEPNQYNNDVIYIESPDGGTWDYENQAVNITNYQYEDTIRAYTEVDGIYDPDGNLHIIWNASGYWADEGTITTDACFVYHWSEETGITMVFDAWHPSFPGAWNRSASKVSISCSASGVLYALWTHFDDIDVSAGGFSNGELYMSYSIDNGVTWTAPENLTNTNTEGCFPGDCESDHWSSLAEVVDENLHILYIEDKDAGGIPQDEGAWTENPVRYLAYPNPVTSVDDDENIPGVFELSQNYPNPFNASTNINFALENEADVHLEVYNLLGEKVDELVNSNLTAGEHTVNWDADEFSSGIYFYTLTAGGASKTKRMVLMK